MDFPIIKRIEIMEKSIIVENHLDNLPSSEPDRNDSSNSSNVVDDNTVDKNTVDENASNFTSDSTGPAVATNDSVNPDENLENIDDITIPSLPKEDLEKIKETIVESSTEQINTMFDNMSKTNMINPNNNRYTSWTEEEYKKYMLRQKIANMRNRRISKAAMKGREKKYNEYLKKNNIIIDGNNNRFSALTSECASQETDNTP